MMHFNYIILTFGLLIFGFHSVVSQEICTLPPKVGKCKASFLRFYFNAATGNCEGFIYGGCGGNKNNFETLGQCRATCQRSETPWNCKLRARKGKCKGKIPRYYYDAFNKRCRLFTYSGCGGNANNFQTFDQCNKACDAFGDIVKPLSPEAMLDMCDQPLDVGPCKENFTRFYYDRTTKICKPFKFGGCNGNRNNFLNREECMQECKLV